MGPFLRRRRAATTTRSAPLHLALNVLLPRDMPYLTTNSRAWQR